MTVGTTRRTGRLIGGVALAVTAAFVAGCGDGAFGKEFREVTAPTFESGVMTIADGLLEGLFAVYNPDSEASSTD